MGRMNYWKRAGAAAVLCLIAMRGSAQAPSSPAEELVGAVERLLADPAALDAAIKRLEPGDGQYPAQRQAYDALLRLTPVGAPEFAPEALDFFESKVRPILVQYCQSCHGTEERKNGLRLDSRAGALTGGKRGPAIVPGDPESSRLVEFIRRMGETKMPPDTPLPDAAIAALTEWVAMGAPWGPDAGPLPSAMELRLAEARQKHWAFQPVNDPAPPATANAAWVKSPIDAFVLARLEEKGLSPSATADRRTLVRRATYDLTGLPPTAEEVDAFTADATGDAFEKVVDRLLASPRFGERWGRHWLDVARYSDTKGYVFQTDPNFPFSHTYRDYVIRAFNDDLPYNTFILQQLAADKLDLGEDKRSLAAMGFLTLGRRFLEVQADIIDDRIDVVSRGLMGLTVSCARCHDHKFDPVPSADYYSLYGVFASSHEPGEWPLIETPDPNDPDYQAYSKELGERQVELDAFVADQHVKVLAHAREKIADYFLAAHDIRAVTDDNTFQTVARDRKLHFQLLQRWKDFLAAKAQAHDPIYAPWTAFAALPPEEFTAKATELAAAFAANNDAEHKIHPRIALAFQGAPPASMAEVAQRYGTALLEADRDWLNLLAAKTQIAIRDASVAAAFPTALPNADMEALRLVLYGVDSPANVAFGEIEQFLDIPTRDRITNLRLAVQRTQSSHPGRPDRAMILADNDKPYDPYVFKRGNAGNRGDDVPRRFPEILTLGERKPFENGSGRLELAQAIASEENPLTARVYANRVWSELLGRPLVATPSDFGLRSDPPSHPELLDHLASSFVKQGWSVKTLIRSIMLSSVYQQDSVPRDEAKAVDPDNRLYWRQNRKRLDFEAMRDALLVASGKLDLAMGGPAVRITGSPHTTRRTIYSFIDRFNLPGIFRTFDLASPDFHSPQRFKTTVPQQALFMMNSPFAVEQARAVAARPEFAEAADPGERARRLYRLLLQRVPDDDELNLARAFVDSPGPAEGPEPPVPTAWQYGFGHLDAATARVDAFAPFAHYVDQRWQPTPNYPDETIGWVTVGRRGGHPGRDDAHASIRRWVAPEDCAIAISSTLRHENSEGDGIAGAIVSSRDGVLWSAAVHNAGEPKELERVVVKAGDTIDFVVACGGNDGFDSYSWAPRIRVVESHTAAPALGRRADWDARADFSGPPPLLPAPLGPWESYAQTLMMTNEMMFVD